MQPNWKRERKHKGLVVNLLGGRMSLTSSKEEETYALAELPVSAL